MPKFWQTGFEEQWSVLKEAYKALNKFERVLKFFQKPWNDLKKSEECMEELFWRV